jgi:hypothetical protein
MAPQFDKPLRDLLRAAGCVAADYGCRLIVLSQTVAGGDFANQLFEMIQV